MEIRIGESRTRVLLFASVHERLSAQEFPEILEVLRSALPVLVCQRCRQGCRQKVLD